MITWQFADGFGNLPEPEAMKVEALVKIAEQLDKLNTIFNELLILLNNKP